MLLEQVQPRDTHINCPRQHEDTELEKIAMVEETNAIINPRLKMVKENKMCNLCNVNMFKTKLDQ